MTRRRTTEAAWLELTDAELVAFYRAGAEKAFTILVKRYQSRIYRVLLGMVADAPLAEELTQRALVKAALRIAQLEDGQAFYAWLLSIARSTALDELRAARRRLWSDRPDDHGQDGDAASAGPAEKQAVLEVLAKLAPEDRMSLVLADMQGLSMKELSVALGVSVSAAKMRLSRARERFRKLYGEAR